MKRFHYYPLLLLLAAGCGEKKADIADNSSNNPPENSAPAKEEENLSDDSAFEFRPENFVSGVNNPYFSIVPGRKYFYDGADPEGIKIHKEILTSDQQREIAGVKALTTWTREWRDDSLVSDVKSWYAQDKEGNVWLLGEKEQNIFGGYIKSKGSEWIAGENNAKAGVIVPASPKAGLELPAVFNGAEEEKAQVLGVSEAIKVRDGELSDCLKIKEFSNSEQTREFHNYYCKGSANLSLEVVPDTFGKIELTRIENGHLSAGLNINYPEFKAQLAEEKAKEIALESIENGDSVSALNIVLRNDKPVYAVDIIDKEKDTHRVFVDVNTGNIFSSEKVRP